LPLLEENLPTTTNFSDRLKVRVGAAIVLLRLCGRGSVSCSVYCRCLQVLLQYGAKRNAVDKDGRTALHYVAYKCSDEESAKTVERIIRELITTAKRRSDALSAFVNRTDMKGKTALHRAAYHGQLQAVQTLLDCQADVRVKDRQGCTPLLAAANAKEVDEVNTVYFLL